PGATGFVKAKWNGLHQLIGVLTSNYERPVVAGVKDLPAAKQTCVHCHAPERFKLDRIKLFPHYDLDKDNTPKFNAMLMRIGGLNPKTHKYQGIPGTRTPTTRSGSSTWTRSATKWERSRCSPRGRSWSSTCRPERRRNRPACAAWIASTVT